MPAPPKNSLTWACHGLAWPAFLWPSLGDTAVKRWLLPILLVLLFPFVGRGQAPDEKKLDAIVADALKAFESPGAAVVVVKGDKVVYLKGAGVRELGKADAITADTIFQIASCTKAFLAMLIDRKSVV